MLQSGEMEQQYTHCRWPESTWICLPCLFRSQMRRVLSRDADTKIKLPLGVKLRSLTTSWWPERFKSRSPVCTSQILICPSLSPVARIRQEISGTWGWWRAQSFLPGGEDHWLKAKAQTICPQSRVFSFGLPRPFVSFLLLRLLASNPLGMNCSSSGQGISLTMQCP